MNTKRLPVDRRSVRMRGCIQGNEITQSIPYFRVAHPSRDAGAVPKPVLLGGSTYPHSLRTERATADGLMAVAAELVPACALGPFQFSRAKGIGTVERSMNHSQSKAKLD